MLWIQHGKLSFKSFKFYFPSCVSFFLVDERFIRVLVVSIFDSLLYYIHVLHFRRVHITTSVLNCLNGDYQVEEGRGQERDSYLKQYNINSYLIVAEHPRVSFCLSIVSSV